MTENTIEIPMSKVMEGVTLRVRVRGAAIYPARVFLATRLLSLAARVLGCRMEIDCIAEPRRG